MRLSKHKHLLAYSILFWLPAIIFCYIAGEILERQPFYLDTAVLNWIHAHSSYFLDNFFLVLTTIGNAEIIAPIALLISGLLYYKRYRQKAIIVFTAFFGAAAANLILKLLFHRTRPAFWQSAIHETGYSFPSGHAMMSSALVLSIIVLVWNTRWQWFAIGIGMPFVALVGYSRLYLGVHYPTDVIAGWLASAAWLSIVVFTLHGYPTIKARFTKHPQ